MKLKYLLSSLFVCLAFFCSSLATTAKAKPHFKVVTAYTKTIPESKQSNPPMAGYFFVIQWDATTLPETFFWRGQNGWLTCKIDKARKVTKNGKTTYTTTDLAIDKIKKGDLLMLTPLTGGRFPIPDEIPASAKNTIFYKTGGSAWLSVPVKKINKK